MKRDWAIILGVGRTSWDGDLCDMTHYGTISFVVLSETAEHLYSQPMRLKDDDYDLALWSVETGVAIVILRDHKSGEVRRAHHIRSDMTPPRLKKMADYIYEVRDGG